MKLNTVMTASIYDITLTIRPDMLVYPKDPAPRFESAQTVAQNGNATTLIHIGSHCGTHIDAPAHFIDGAPGVDQVALASCVGPCTVFSIAPASLEITTADLAKLTLGERVLFHTSNSDRQLLHQTEFHADFVGLTAEAADLLIERGVKLIGVDYLSCERGTNNVWPVHQKLLNHGIVIIESCDLSAVPAGEYTLTALPLKLHELDGSPCRVILQR